MGGAGGGVEFLLPPPPLSSSLVVFPRRVRFSAPRRVASHGRDGSGEQAQQKTRSSREERRARRDEGKRAHVGCACVKNQL